MLKVRCPAGSIGSVLSLREQSARSRRERALSSSLSSVTHLDRCGSLISTDHIRLPVVLVFGLGSIKPSSSFVSSVLRSICSLQDPPYSSEAYSEKCVDESIVQRITNFGDDYSAIFSTSSCCTVDMSSSHSQQEQEQEHVSSDTDWDCQREKNMFFDGGGDEESVLAESRRQLRIAQTALALSLEGQVGCCDLVSLFSKRLPTA